MEHLFRNKIKNLPPDTSVLPVFYKMQYFCLYLQKKNISYVFWSIILGVATVFKWNCLH